ncbi:hypothetical protein CQ022_03475 [Chryseobacterium culicis]|uniref:Uncharacterized protein n=2 Tax=Chryseobacterium culicis TaxID=680127 RepID=A0A2S9D367_CHRCI|nr:hypothetical protein CQ022_03475 [Chryseobacterium culicis]PRB91400.1 hypothetical protein CQ033_09515 [Chryseobacterium culicis]
MGQMMGLPFIFWLVFTAFDFGNIDQVFAVLGLLGIVLTISRWKNKVSITILSFIMMLSPIVSKMIQVPIEKFNYLAFKIPLILFVACYLIFIILNAKKRKPVVSL